MTEEQWATIDPTIRKEGSEVWILWNPRLLTDFVQAKLPSLLGDSCVIRHINYDENPFLSDTARAKAERLKEIDPQQYEHIYLGCPMSSDEAAVIPAAWVQAAIDAHIKLGIKPTGKRVAGFDVADEGKDKLAICLAHGILVEHIEEWSGKGDDIYGSVVKAFDICDRLGYQELKYDGDGLGAGVRGDARVLNEKRVEDGRKAITVQKFQGSAGVWKPEKEFIEGRKNEDYFSNAKAQGWWMLRERFKMTYRAVVEGMTVDPDDIISIDSKIPVLGKLVTELSQPTHGLNNAGKIVIDKQPDGVLSPNLADSVMIRFAPAQIKSATFMTAGMRR